MKVTAILASLLLASATAGDGTRIVERLRSDDVGRNLNNGRSKPTSGPPGQSGSATRQQSKAAKNAKVRNLNIFSMVKVQEVSLTKSHMNVNLHSS